MAVLALAVFAFPYSLADHETVQSDSRILFDMDSVESRVQVAVVEALMLYASHGTEAFDIITPEENAYTDALYVFVLDADTLESVASGAYADFAGVIPDSITHTDKPVDDILAEISLNGAAWVEYMATNPDTRTIELKSSWLYLHDGYIFGAGHYLPESRVLDVVEDAVLLYEAEDIKAFDIITPDLDMPVRVFTEPEGSETGFGVDIAVSTSELYPFVLNATDWSTVAHATIPSRVGACCSYAIQNTGDRPIEVITEDLHRDGGTWVEYLFINPDTETEQLKRTWLYLYDGYIFGSGYYIQDSRVQSTVEEAIHLYTSNGMDAFDMITPDATVQLATDYAFVLDGATLNIVAHGALPYKVGTTHDVLTHADRPLERILADLEDEDGTWVAYMDENPYTSTDQLFRTYLSLHDDYIFGSSYSMPDSRVQSLVDESIYTYRSHGMEAFEQIDSGDLNRLGIYPFVRNLTHIQAHGTNPGLIGPLPEVQTARTYEETWNEAVEGDGTVWSQYAFISPYTGTDQIKRAYLQLHDGHLFASTYNVADADARSAVDHAIFIYKHNKENDAWIDIITPEEPIITDKLYPFVINLTSWTRLADGVLPERVGVRETILDTATRPMDDIIEELKTNGSVWATYTFDNPAIRADQIKRSYLELRDGLIFGSGYYVLDTQVQSIAYNQVLEYNHNGRDATLTEINTIPDEAVSTYIFVANPDTDMVEAQNADPEILGMSDWDSIIAITDKAMLLKELETEAGAWVGYKITNPTTGQIEDKRAWIIMHDGLIFGSGYYASDSTP